MTTTVLPLNVDYTQKDFASLRSRLFLLIQSVFPTWTSSAVADFGNILVELFAFTGDVVTFYQDNQAGEAFLATARLRRSLLALSKLVGYTPPGAAAATVDILVTLAAPVQAGATLTILRGDKALTSEVANPVQFQFLDDVVFAAGEQTQTITVENSEYATSTVISTGLANQLISLASTPYLDGSAVVSFADGAYIEVFDFLESTPTDRHFVVTVDQDDRASLRFGNGVNGTIPQASGEVVYRIGGGAGGRVEAHKITRLEHTYQDSFGAPVAITVDNVAASSGAADRETNAAIRQNAPASLRVLRRAIAREDFEIVAEARPGVARALAVTRNEYAAVEENTVRLLVVPDGGGTPSGGLLADVLAQFQADGPYPKANTLNLIVQAAPYAVMDIASTVFLRQGFSRATVRANIVAALTALFALLNADGTKNTGVDWGFNIQGDDGEPVGALPWSDVFNAIRDAAGVLRIDPSASVQINGSQTDPPLGTIEFPVLGAVTLTDGATGTLF